MKLRQEHADDPVLGLFSEHSKLYLQIFKDSQLVYSSTEGLSTFPSQKIGDPFTFEVGINLEGDYLVRIRHFLASEIRYPVARFMVNSAFLEDGTTNISKYSLDLGAEVECDPDFMIKLEVNPTEEFSEYSQNLLQIRTKHKFATYSRSKISISPENATEASPSKSNPFVIDDSPLKVSSPSPANSGSKGGVFFTEDSTGNSGSLNSLATISNSSEGDNEKEGSDEEPEDMAAYLKSLEEKAN